MSFMEHPQPDACRALMPTPENRPPGPPSRPIVCYMPKGHDETDGHAETRRPGPLTRRWHGDARPQVTAVDRPDNGQDEGCSHYAAAGLSGLRCGTCAGAGEQQQERVARWLEQKYLAVRAGQPWSQSADAVELLALLDRTQPDGEADRTRYESHQWMGGGDDEDCCAACGVSWIDCEGPCNPRPCPVYSHGTDGWHCAVEGPHDEHRNAAGTETW